MKYKGHQETRITALLQRHFPLSNIAGVLGSSSPVQDCQTSSASGTVEPKWNNGVRVGVSDGPAW